MLMHFHAMAVPYINGPLSEWPPAQVEVVNKLLSSGLIEESVYGYSTTADGGLVVEQLKTLLQGILQERGPHAEIARLNALLAKHGVCTRCSELFEHDYETPFASCGCKQSEWHKLTPHMLAVQRAREVAP